MSRRTTKIATDAVATMLVESACGGESGGSCGEGSSSEDIVVGTTTGLTGAIASACKPINDGSLAWFDAFNEAGGVDGRMIKNIVLDDGYDAAKALANARELAADGVLAFFGGCGSLQPPAVVTVSDREKIPYIMPSAGLPEIITNEHIRTAYPLFADQLRGIVEWEMERSGPGKAFVINARQPGHETTLAAAAEGAEAAGGEVVDTFTVNSGESNWGPIALKVKQADVDYVVMHLTAADAARLVKALQDSSAVPAKSFIGTSVMLSDAFLGPVGTSVDGKIVTPANVAPPTSEKAKSCLDEMEARDVPADQSSLAGCAFAQVLTTALSETEDLTREGLLATIDSWKDKSATDLLPPLTFSSTQHIGMSTMEILTVENGKPVLIDGESFGLTLR